MNFFFSRNIYTRAMLTDNFRQEFVVRNMLIHAGHDFFGFLIHAFVVPRRIQCYELVAQLVVQSHQGYGLNGHVGMLVYSVVALIIIRTGTRCGG